MKIKKEKSTGKRSKKAQVTIFVILAIALVALVLFLFYPNIKGIFIPKTPSELIPRTCIEKEVRAVLNKTMLQGGTLNPKLYFNYNTYKLDYLCYTSQWYQTCDMQKPFLKNDIENQVRESSQTGITKCLADMKSNLESQGYSVKITGTKRAEVNIQLDKISVPIDMTMVLEKGEEKLVLESSAFKTDFTSKAYEIIMVASSIQNFEARYGDSNTEQFMALYPNLRIQKLKQSDGTKVYTITDRNTGELLQFATRSLAWPPGFAVQ